MCSVFYKDCWSGSSDIIDWVNIYKIILVVICDYIIDLIIKLS